MLSYCLKCRKKTESKNQSVEKNKNQKNDAFIKLRGFMIVKNQNLSKNKKPKGY